MLGSKNNDERFTKSTDVILMENLNNLLVNISKMPTDLVHQSTSKPEISDDEYKILQKASDAYNSDYFETAITYYKQCAAMNKKNPKTIDNCQSAQWDIVVQYLISQCLLQSKKFIDLLEAKNILLTLEENFGLQYPMFYYGLAKFYIQVYCFKDAEKVINTGISILNNIKSLKHCYIPGPNTLIHESTKEGLTSCLLSLKDEFSGWHRPDAVCSMINCKLIHPNHVTDRNIFFKSPAFNGMVTVTCNNTHPCNLKFHTACWKVKKDQLNSSKKMSDKDFQNYPCFTPNCINNGQPSIIKKIEIYCEDASIKTTIIQLEDQDRRIQPSPTKGAIRKQKASKPVHIKFERSKTPLKPIQVSKSRKIINSEEEMLASRVLRLIQLRKNHFYIQEDHDWRPDLPFYGNLKMIENNDQYPDEPDSSDELQAGLKSFLYSYFYEYISNNAPIKIDQLLKKWEEAADMMNLNGDSLLYDFHYTCVTDFLLESLKFVVIGECICTPPTMQTTYLLVKNNIVTTLRCLMVNNENLQLEAEQELLKSIMYNSKDDKSDSNSTIETNLESDLEDNSKTDNIQQPIKTMQKVTSIDFSNENQKVPEETDIPVEEKLVDYDPEISIEILKQDYKHEEISTDNSKTICNNNHQFESNDKILTNGENQNMLEISENMIIKTLKNQIKESNNAHEHIKKQYITIKTQLLLAELRTQYIRNKTTIQSALDQLDYEYEIVMKIQSVLYSTIQSQLPVDPAQWLLPINELKRCREALEKDYNICMQIFNSFRDGQIPTGDIKLQAIKMPKVPSKSIPYYVHMALEMYQRFTISQIPNVERALNTTKLLSSPPHPPLMYPNSEMYAQKIPCSPKHLVNQNYDQLSSVPVIDRSMFAVKIQSHTPELSHTNKSVDYQYNEINKLTEALPQLHIHDEINVITPTKMTDEQKEIKDLPKNALGTTVTCVKEEQMPIEHDKKNYNYVEITNSTNSLDKLITLLESRNKHIMKCDLLWSVKTVRKNHNNSLSGLTLSTILHEAEELLSHHEKFQLVNYTTTLPSKISISLSSKTSVTTNSSDVTMVKHSPKEFLPKNTVNPWAPISNLTWHKEEIDNECVICMENINKSTDNPPYTLKCQHTFHYKCVRDWFSLDRSCPICRVHSTLDDEFPPLP